jgi:hypothetical protein
MHSAYIMQGIYTQLFWSCSWWQVPQCMLCRVPLESTPCVPIGGTAWTLGAGQVPPLPPNVCTFHVEYTSWVPTGVAPLRQHKPRGQYDAIAVCGRPLTVHTAVASVPKPLLAHQCMPGVGRVTGSCSLPLNSHGLYRSMCHLHGTDSTEARKTISHVSPCWEVPPTHHPAQASIPVVHPTNTSAGTIGEQPTAPQYVCPYHPSMSDSSGW